MQFQQLSISFYVNLYGNPQNCPATLCITLKSAWKKKMISTEIAAHNGILALDLLWNVDEK